MLFTDLVGSTELMTGLGDLAFDQLRSQHFAELRAVITGAGGTEIKNIGDGLLATFTSAVDALAVAGRAQQVTDHQGRAVGIPLALRVGLALGEVAVEDGDVFGTPVVEAARLVAVARPGQILATALVRAVAGTRAGVTFGDLGPLDLKGLPEPVPVCEVGWEPLAGRVDAGVPLPGLLVGTGRIFVGRDRELERLRTRWKEAAAGGQTLVLLGGEPGIGKTRLAAEFAAAVQADGALVLGGRCDQDMGVPYQPFVEALRHYVTHAAAPLRLGRHPGELTRLVPELGDLVPDLPEPLRSDPETERYRLFDALAAWLADVSLEGWPLLLVLDDLHWAAKPTFLLLRHVLRPSQPMRLMVLATYRDTDVVPGHPMGELLADVPRLGGAERLPLTGLDPLGVEAFVAAAAGHELDEESEALARMVWRETEGNCFFVAEVLRHLSESRAIELRDGRWVTTAGVDQIGIPEGVRDVVLGRVGRLSPEINSVLCAAAVAGLEFDLRVVGAAGGFNEEEFVGALDGAVAARLLVEVPGPIPRNRFSHALVRAALYDGLTVARRRLLHRRLAETVEAIHEGGLDDHLPALAHHWRESGADPDRAIDYATRAGHRALAQLAHDEAARFYAAALELTGPDSPQALELMIALGDARHRAGDVGHRDVLFRAARLAKTRGDGNALARAALAATRPGFTISVGGVDPELIAVLEEAVDAGIDSPGLQARVLAALALATVFAQDRARLLELSDRALALARDSGDPASLASVLASRAYSMMDPATLGLRLQDTAELVELAGHLGDPGVEFSAHWIRGRALLDTGDVAGGLHHAERCRELADDLGQPPLRWMSRWVSVGPVLLAGRIEEAERMLEAAEELGRLSSQPGTDAVAAVQGVVVRFEQDRMQEAERVLSEVAPRYPGVPGLAALVAWARCADGRLEEARATLAVLAGTSFELPIDPTWHVMMCAAAEVVHHVGDVEAARVLYPRLAPWADVWANTGGISVGVTAYYLGLLATSIGETELAERHFADAAMRYEAAGAPAHLGRTQLEQARSLAQRGDRIAARQLVEHALAVAEELALVNVQRRARALLDSLR